MTDQTSNTRVTRDQNERLGRIPAPGHQESLSRSGNRTQPSVASTCNKFVRTLQQLKNWCLGYPLHASPGPSAASPPHRPLIKITLGFLTGITVAHLFSVPTFPVWIGILLLPAVLWVKWKQRPRGLFHPSRVWFLIVMAAFVGILRVEHLETDWRDRDRELEALSRSGSVQIAALVSDAVTGANGKLRLVLESVELQRWSTRRVLPGSLILHPAKESPLTGVQPGDWITARVRLSPMRPAHLPGGFDSRAYFYTESIVGRAFAEAGSGAILDTAPSSSWWSWWRRRSDQAARLIHEHLPQENAELVAALLVGRRGFTSKELKNAFIDSGLLHVTAISGLHTTLWLMAVLLLLRKLGLSRRQAAWLTPFLLLAFVALVGARVPTVRAAILAGLIAGGTLLARRSDSLTSLTAALLAILAVQPAQAWGASLQLSFTAVTALILLGPGQGHEARGVIRRSVQWLARGLGASFIVTVALLPLVLYHFGRGAPIAVLANLPAIPVLGALLISGYSWLLLAGLGLQALAAPFIWLVATLSDGLIFIAETAARVPGGHFETPDVSPVVLLGIVGLVAVAATPTRWLLQNQSRARLWLQTLSFPRVTLALLVVAVTVLGDVAWSHLRPTHVDFLALGNGDSTLLRSKEGAVVLVDGGAPPKADSEYAPSLLSYLDSQGIRRIDLLVLTHPEADHIGALPELLESVSVQRIVTSGRRHESQAFARFLQASARAGIPLEPVRHGTRIEGLPGIELTVLHPRTGRAHDGSEDLNQDSVVLLASLENTTLLLTGDIDLETERILVGEGLIPDVDILKVPHHGSKYSTSFELLDATRPELAVIEVGGNFYGHPTPETLKRLYSAGAYVFRTDRDGTVRVVLGRDRTNMAGAYRSGTLVRFGR